MKLWSILGKNGQNCPKMALKSWIVNFYCYIYQDRVILDDFGDKIGQNSQNGNNWTKIAPFWTIKS